MFASKNNLSPQRKAILNQFQKKTNIRFKNLDLLDQAFHHRSFSNESNHNTTNNERLEFLGDAVLGMVVATNLYTTMKDKTEGDLAKIKSVVVSEATLSKIALDIGIDSCLVLGRGEELSGGRTKKAILADAMEAVIGALYLDSGYKIVEKYVLSYITEEIKNVVQHKSVQDYKTMLQEFFQKKYKTCPEYKLVKKNGPDHDKTFWVSVHLNGVEYGPAAGKNKKEAEQGAAKLAWDYITST